MKNRQRGERLSPCRIHVVWGCCSTKFGWFILARGTKNWWIHHCCDDVHGCYQFFTMPVDVLFGHITRYPHDTKIRPMSRHNLRLPPWRNIGRIWIGFKLEANIWIQSGGGPSIKMFFFSILTHRARWLFGDAHTFAESRSTCEFVHHSR
jgi:hypothetical protein